MGLTGCWEQTSFFFKMSLALNLLPFFVSYLNLPFLSLLSLDCLTANCLQAFIGSRESKKIFRENLLSRVSAFEDEDGKRKSEGENKKKKKEEKREKMKLSLWMNKRRSLTKTGSCLWLALWSLAATQKWHQSENKKTLSATGGGIGWGGTLVKNCVTGHKQ